MGDGYLVERVLGGCLATAFAAATAVGVSMAATSLAPLFHDASFADPGGVVLGGLIAAAGIFGFGFGAGNVIWPDQYHD